MITTLTPDVEGYRKFLSIKQLPRYKFTGRTAWFPDEYASRIGLKPEAKRDRKYSPPDWMMDYQRDIAECKKNLTTATTLSQEKSLFDTEEAA